MSIWTIYSSDSSSSSSNSNAHRNHCHHARAGPENDTSVTPVEDPAELDSVGKSIGVNEHRCANSATPASDISVAPPASDFVGDSYLEHLRKIDEHMQSGMSSPLASPANGSISRCAAAAQVAPWSISAPSEVACAPLVSAHALEYCSSSYCYCGGRTIEGSGYVRPASPSTRPS